MRKLIKVPDKRLEKICSPVKEIDCSTREIIRDLFAYIDNKNVTFEKGTVRLQALGLAAPQLGHLVSIFVIATSALRVAVINPKIVKTVGEKMLYEGCLSMPGRLFVTKRPKLVKITGMDEKGNKRSFKFRDELAQAAMHEMEHLQGITVDRVAITEIPQEIR